MSWSCWWCTLYVTDLDDDMFRPSCFDKQCWWQDLWPEVAMSRWKDVDEQMMSKKWWAAVMSMSRYGWEAYWWKSMIDIKLASSDLHLRIGLRKPFLVGAKKTRLGPIIELVLFLSVGVDYNWEYCSLTCTINKDKITNILVSLWCHECSYDSRLI